MLLWKKVALAAALVILPATAYAAHELCAGCPCGADCDCADCDCAS